VRLVHLRGKVTQFGPESGQGEAAKLTLVLDTPRELTLSLRRPYWAAEGFSVSVNGQAVRVPDTLEEGAVSEQRGRTQYDWSYAASSFVELARTWQSGDTVELTLPKSLRLEPVPDNPRRAAILWGPLVLAGDLGPEAARGRVEGEGLQPPPKVPVFVAAERPVSSWLERVDGAPVRFRTNGAGREPDAHGRVHDVDLVPFYRLHRRTYSTYWDLFTPAEWEVQRTTYAAEAARRGKLEAATVAYLEPGEIVFEREFNYQGGDDATTDRILGRPGRRGQSWFSYDVPVDPAHPMALILTYYSDDRRGLPADFEILVDGRHLADQAIERTDPPRFFDVEVPIPEELVRGKDAVAVRFQARQRSRIATVFGVRVIRADAER